MMCSNLDTSHLLSLVETRFGKAGYSTRESSREGSTLERVGSKGRTLTLVVSLELVSKELNHFGVIAGLFRQIGGHSSRFVLFCSF